MLRSFSVKGFKNFKDEIILDLSDVKEYDFNEVCILDNTIRSSITYGHNSSGKSNFGEAIFDIVANLTDKNLEFSLSIIPSLNGAIKLVNLFPILSQVSFTSFLKSISFAFLIPFLPLLSSICNLVLNFYLIHTHIRKLQHIPNLLTAFFAVMRAAHTYLQSPVL